MVRKSFALALCFTTIMNSIAFSMDAPSVDPSSSQISTTSARLNLHLEEEHLKAFYQQISPTSLTLNRNIPRALTESFTQGARSGFADYTSDTVDFMRRLWNGEFNSLSQTSIQALIKNHFGTVIEQYLPKHADTKDKGEVDSATLTKLFTSMREHAYWALLRSNLFGAPKKVYIPERGVTETHYDVTTNLSSSFLNALIPNALPLKGILVGLANNNLVNTFMLRRIDNLFAKMVLGLSAKLTGRKVSDLLPYLVAAPALTGTITLTQAYYLFNEDYPDAEFVPELTKESESLSKIWEYLEPRLSHYIRLGLTETIMSMVGFTADKISEPVFLKASKIIANNSSGIRTLTSLAAYGIGEASTSIPYLDGAATGILAYWAIGGIVNASIPRGLEASRQTLLQTINDQVHLLADYYTYGLLPLSSNEHRLFGLNEAPSSEELALFRTDYEARDRLMAESLLTAALQDLYKTSANLFLGLPGVSGLTERLWGLIRSGDTTTAVAATSLLTDGRSHANPKHLDTAARLKLYQIAAIIGKNKTDKDAFDLATSRLGSIWNYITGSGFSEQQLSEEDQALLDAIIEYPSFEMRQDELELLANQFTWVSQNDKHKKLEPYMDEQNLLSKQFIDDATRVIALQSQAIKNLKGTVGNPTAALQGLQLELPFEEYLLALEAINTGTTREQFFVSQDRRLAELPAFHIALSEFRELAENHPKLIKFVQTSTLGANMTSRKQLELAQELSQHEDALEKLQDGILSREKSLSTITSTGLWGRFEAYRNAYLGHVYAEKFIADLGDETFSQIIKTLLEDSRVKKSESGPHNTIFQIMCSEDPSTKSFRDQLKGIGLNESARMQCYGFIKGKILEEIEKQHALGQQKEKELPQQTGGWGIWPMSAEPSSSVPSEPIDIPTVDFTNKLPPLEFIEIQSLDTDPFEAYLVAKVIRDMIANNPQVFGGRTGTTLTKSDMRLVCDKIDQTRLTHVLSSDDLALITKHPGELAHIVATMDKFNQSVVWTYDDLLTKLRNRNTQLVQSIRYPNGLNGLIIDDYRDGHQPSSGDEIPSSPEDGQLLTDQH